MKFTNAFAPRRHSGDQGKKTSTKSGIMLRLRESVINGEIRPVVVVTIAADTMGRMGIHCKESMMLQFDETFMYARILPGDGYRMQPSRKETLKELSESNNGAKVVGDASFIIPLQSFDERNRPIIKARLEGGPISHMDPGITVDPKTHSALVNFQRFDG